ncbi:hypothetical protein B0H66DRAFT_123060 [Apodospora peruviana]|uniref:Uncharacterized protein n=1 Tax=Apodospora peruviana TaxID=516989 RepID=A0AAE0IIK9_9PEZI|nr:hypothetical protein B0H66DRAFT_123060 [Apodospora peruviana]
MCILLTKPNWDCRIKRVGLWEKRNSRHWRFRPAACLHESISGLWSLERLASCIQTLGRAHPRPRRRAQDPVPMSHLHRGKESLTVRLLSRLRAGQTLKIACSPIMSCQEPRPPAQPSPRHCRARRLVRDPESCCPGYTHPGFVRPGNRYKHSGIIALGVFKKNWTFDHTKSLFRSLTKDAFSLRPRLSVPVISALIELVLCISVAQVGLTRAMDGSLRVTMKALMDTNEKVKKAIGQDLELARQLQVLAVVDDEADGADGMDGADAVVNLAGANIDLECCLGDGGAQNGTSGEESSTGLDNPSNGRDYIIVDNFTRGQVQGMMGNIGLEQWEKRNVDNQWKSFRGCCF